MNKFQQILLKHWGFSSFRDLQEEIITEVYEGKDALGLMPTGGGKSITFQVPALLKDGICLVVTPLVALMIDQVNNLKKRGIKALCIHSGLSYDEIKIALNNALYGDFKFLYISPERIQTELFKNILKDLPLNIIAVDEAHCISQWGYDFRPSYLNIAYLRTVFPEIPVLALTATATQDVVDDIQEKLKFRKKNVLRKSFFRENLAYVVKKTEDKEKELVNIVQKLKTCGIIYVRNRKKTKEIAGLLKSNRIDADYYHAGLSSEQRTFKQTRWTNNQFRVMVATNAFGMGIDKPDVRFVLHYDLPNSLEEYFQEAGRAGRDGKKSYAVMLYHNNDKSSAQKRYSTNFPETEAIKKIYNALGSYYQVPLGAGKGMTLDFNLRDFASRYKLNPLLTYNGLKLLEQEGYINLIDEIDVPSRVHFLVSRDDLYKFQVANVQFDSFIKLLLRSYTGMFSDYVAIDEVMLSKRAGTDVDTIYKYLNKLTVSGVIKYIPRKHNPMVVFSEERLDEKNLRLNTKTYNSKKERYKTKLDAVLHYAQQESKCRSSALLSYFGEEVTRRCGKCDICIKRNEIGLSRYEFDLILEEIKKKLTDNTYFINALVESVKYNPDKVIKVIRYLLDSGKITKNDNEALIWTKD